MTVLSQAPKKLKELQTDKKLQVYNLQQKTDAKTLFRFFETGFKIMNLFFP